MASLPWLYSSSNKTSLSELLAAYLVSGWACLRLRSFKCYTDIDPCLWNSYSLLSLLWSWERLYNPQDSLFHLCFNVANYGVKNFDTTSSPRLPGYSLELLRDILSWTSSIPNLPRICLAGAMYQSSHHWLDSFPQYLRLVPFFHWSAPFSVDTASVLAAPVLDLSYMASVCPATYSYLAAPVGFLNYIASVRENSSPCPFSNYPAAASNSMASVRVAVVAFWLAVVGVLVTVVEEWVTPV